MLTPDEQAEIERLAKQLGTPLLRKREFIATTERDIDWLHRQIRRRGEVILVVPRPNGRVLLHTKSNYPSGIYRLPGGGVNPGEELLHAAEREVQEETGFDVPMARFLGVVDNEFQVPGNRLSYPSYVFLTQPTTGAPRVMDPDEDISDFGEVPIEELSQVAAQLEGMSPEWQLWGQFRATPHTIALEALTNDRRPPTADRR